jgi:hypothetical protein
MRTNKGKFDKSRAKNEKPDSELNCVTEDGFSVKIFLNSSKDKLIFKINFPEVKKYYYSKEFTYDELTKICPLFLIEENIININNLIKESVKNNGIKTSNTTNEKKINLIIPIQINSRMKEIQLELDQIEFNEEEFFSSLVQKVNILLDERKEIYGIKSFGDIREEMHSNKDHFFTLIRQIEDKYEKLNIIFNFMKENNLLANSNIISTSSDINLILDTLKKIEEESNKTKKNNKSYLYQNNSGIIFKLVYRATRDGDSARDFHERCDTIGPNITLIKTNKNVRFGGFTNCNWALPDEVDDKKDGEKGAEKSDPDSFCFSLSSKKIYFHNEKKEGAIFCSNGYGPTFSNNIFAVNNNMLSKGGYCTKKDKSCFEGQKKDYEISGGDKYFKIKELEVFEIITI